jgi:2-iminoacetate synthase
MSFYSIYSQHKDLDNLFCGIPPHGIEHALQVDSADILDFARLLSFQAGGCLEELAQKARGLTLQYFGKTIQLYTPLYLSNYCQNGCVYCGFNSGHKFKRNKLTMPKLEKEAEFISSTGLRHVLILTGESREESPLTYIKDCIGLLKKYFSSISVEIYPLDEDEYADLVAAGIDGLTIYQEVYDEDIYARVHPFGPKKDYLFRLDAPERGLKAKVRFVNIGALLGLNDWRKEVFLMGLHAQYLQGKFPDAEIGVSLPRLRPFSGDFKVPFIVGDADIVQIILALRIFLPRVGISISTREPAQLRDNLIPLGITRMSAGSTTRVGGHTAVIQPGSNPAQFQISDERSVTEVKIALQGKGYQPVLKDWLNF